MSANGMFEKNGRRLSFSAHHDFVLLDHTEITACPAPVNYNGTFYARAAFFDTVKQIFENLPPEVHFRIGAILIDPGHGGQDPGAVADHIVNGKKKTLREKDIVLFTARDLYARLKETYPDKKIMLTRNTDTFLTLNQRTDIANTVKLAEHEAILYVSLHANSAFHAKAKGFEVWYLSPGYRRTLIKSTGGDKDKDVVPILNSMMEEEFTTESILIAKYIQDGIREQVGGLSPDRGIKEEEWFVVRNANMPSVLVELGFVTNPEEALLLFDQNYLRKLSVGIYNGLTAFVSHFENSRGFTGIK
ncbi:N-acetylmuramoyl-L-alanine amidase [Treponema sp. OMZ 840]